MNLGDLAHEALERETLDEEVGALLVLADLTERNGTWSFFDRLPRSAAKPRIADIQAHMRRYSSCPRPLKILVRCSCTPVSCNARLDPSTWDPDTRSKLLQRAPGRKRFGFFMPTVVGADLRAAFEANCLRGAWRETALWIPTCSARRPPSLADAPRPDVSPAQVLLRLFEQLRARICARWYSAQ